MSEYNWNLFSKHTSNVSIFFFRIRSQPHWTKSKAIIIQSYHKWQYFDLNWIRYKVDSFYNEQQSILTVLAQVANPVYFLEFFLTRLILLSVYTDILMISCTVKLPDKVSISHTKRVGDNKTVFTSQMCCHWFIPLKYFRNIMKFLPCFKTSKLCWYSWYLYVSACQYSFWSAVTFWAAKFQVDFKEGGGVRLT